MNSIDWALGISLLLAASVLCSSCVGKVRSHLETRRQNQPEPIVLKPHRFS